MIAVAGAQDDPAIYDPAPLPGFSEDKDFYTYLTIPSDEDFGDFANNVSYAGFALWDDSENADL